MGLWREIQKPLGGRILCGAFQKKPTRFKRICQKLKHQHSAILGIKAQ